MKIIISMFMIVFSSVLYAQNNMLERIYNQIPPIQHKLLCENADSYIETTTQIESLSAQLEEIKIGLNEKQKNNGDATYNAISAGFPTDEELKKVDKLSEAEQQAFWEKLAANQNQADLVIASNSLKYEDEKAKLSEKVAEYQNEMLAISEEFSEIHSVASKEYSDKRQNIYNTHMVNNTLTEHGQQQLTVIAVELCSTVSPILLKKLRFEYSNLKQNVSIYKRLTVMDLAEFSTLEEKVVSEQNAAMLDLTELEILEQFLINYRDLFSILPVSIGKYESE